MMTDDIVKANALIEAHYNPDSLWEMRLLIACLMQIKAADDMDHTQVFSIASNALADLTGTLAKSNYRHLKRAARELVRMVVEVELNPDGSRRSKRMREMNIVSHCDYIEDEGRVELVFTPSIIPYISSLKTRFTKYQAKYVMPMRSGYGIRLYELCLQWLGDEREFEVDEFKELLGLGNQYPRLADLKRRVIRPALKDINAHTDIRVRFGQRKAGRTITHLQFQITRLADPDALATTPKKIIFDDYVKEHSNPGETWDQAKERLRPQWEKL